MISQGECGPCVLQNGIARQARQQHPGNSHITVRTLRMWKTPFLLLMQPFFFLRGGGFSCPVLADALFVVVFFLNLRRKWERTSGFDLFLESLCSFYQNMGLVHFCMF